MKMKLFSAATLFALLTSSALLLASCEKEDNVNNDVTYTLSGNASGSQEVPAVSTTASGTLSGKYNATSNLFEYDIDFTGLSGTVSVAHMHGPALAGVSAPPVVDLSITTNGINGELKGSATLHDSMEAHLLSGKLYYNIHTVANPNGEIRGQVQAVLD
jgi:hypothetical protein